MKRKQDKKQYTIYEDSEWNGVIGLRKKLCPFMRTFTIHNKSNICSAELKLIPSYISIVGRSRISKVSSYVEL